MNNLNIIASSSSGNAHIDEVWKPIVGYEGLYEVSNLGRVKTLKINNDKARHQKTKILKQCKNSSGYLIVNLSNKTKRVHRLVAMTFIPNPNKLPIINHKDGNKLNNNVSNLEWCTHSYNNKEAYKLGLKTGYLKNKTGINYPRKLNIIGMFDDNGNLIEKFYGCCEPYRKYKYSPIAILDCCKGKYKKMYGYKWRFINE